jgi:FkbM family methyltransferase
VDYSHGSKLCVDPFEYIGSRIVEGGAYEAEVADTLSRFFVSDEVFWDIGAHVGSNSVHAGTDRRVASVHAFECSPVTLDVLQFNRALNGNSFEIHPFAITDHSGEMMPFLASRDESSKASLEPLPSEVLASAFSTVSVESMSVDDIVATSVAPSPTVMKVDVEGHELKVFSGAARTLADERLKAVVFEAAHDGSGRIADRRLNSLFEDAGFAVGRIMRPGGALDRNENFVAYRERALESSSAPFEVGPA